MKTIFYISQNNFEALNKHLTPKQQEVEECAFVFADVYEKDSITIFRFKDWYPVSKADYKSRSAFHIDLTYSAQARIIKKAHDLNSSLIELHSHLDQEKVSFSNSDWHGFSSFVPHVMWRLKGKPYMAIVVSAMEFDALVWLTNPDIPTSLDQINVEGKILKPTNSSITRFYERQ